MKFKIKHEKANLVFMTSVLILCLFTCIIWLMIREYSYFIIYLLLTLLIAIFYYNTYFYIKNDGLIIKLGFIKVKIEGKHNFHAFTSDTPIEECIRTINYIKITKEDKLVCIYICASGFLKYMVRNIVGLMLEINEGKKDIEIISKLFKDKNRSDNAVKASPEGLYLNKVNYK